MTAATSLQAPAGAPAGWDAMALLVSAAGVGLLQVRHGVIIDANAAAASLLGADREALRGTDLQTWWADASHELVALMRQAQSSVPPTVATAEGRLRRADGSACPVRLNCAVSPQSGAAAPVIFLSLSALEADSQAVVRGARAQASLQRVLETAPMAMALFEWPSHRLLQLNQRAAEFFGASVADLLDRAPTQWPSAVTAEEAAELCAHLDLAGEFPTGVRREVERPSLEAGAQRVWDMRMVSAHAGEELSGDPGQILMVATEVTDLRVAEQERFDAAIAQRGMLVQEVHHRIKNNLQGVAGLLQQASARFPEVAPILSDAVGQLQAIAQVYGLQVGTSGPVGLVGLLRAVAGSVQKTFHHPIEVMVEGEDAERWRLPEAESIPVALTANELLTNAIKHGSQAPVICRLTAGAAEVVLEVQSRGQLRAGFDLGAVPSGASGLGLVRALLPRRAAEFTLRQVGDEVVARVLLRPPAVRKDG